MGRSELRALQVSPRPRVSQPQADHNAFTALEDDAHGLRVGSAFSHCLFSP